MGSNIPRRHSCYNSVYVKIAVTFGQESYDLRQQAAFWTDGAHRCGRGGDHRAGARLLARTTRSLSLTDEGRRFYEQVGPHLTGIEEAAIEASGSANKVF